MRVSNCAEFLASRPSIKRQNPLRSVSAERNISQDGETCRSGMVAFVDDVRTWWVNLPEAARRAITKSTRKLVGDAHSDNSKLAPKKG